jgi:hypothetical protein
MALYKEGCGHPTEWNLRVVMNGAKYTYCIGCMVEKLGLDNLEPYDNPFVNVKKEAPKKSKSKKPKGPDVDEKI